MGNTIMFLKLYDEIHGTCSLYVNFKNWKVTNRSNKCLLNETKNEAHRLRNLSKVAELPVSP